MEILLTSLGVLTIAVLVILVGTGGKTIGVELALHLPIAPGEPLQIDLTTFRSALTAKNHTVKRALTDPRIFSGIGNAYSDEILHRAGLSPLQLSTNLDEEEIERVMTFLRDEGVSVFEGLGSES